VGCLLLSCSSKHPLLFKLTLFGVALAIVVVVLGAFTRLVDAGLGCPDWPGCYGHLLWPNTQQEIIQAEVAFPDAPVELDKTWPEMVHRYFAGTLGLLILGVTLTALRKRSLIGTASNYDAVPIKLPLLLLVLVIIQALFGMWTVTLKLWPQIVTAHLLGGFATLSLLWLLNQRLSGIVWQLEQPQLQALQRLRPAVVVCLLLVIAQITLGGWTSSNYAALACPDLPTCLGRWLPPMDFSSGFNIFQDVGPNYLGGLLDNHARTAIHFTHRSGALVVTCALIGLGVSLYRTHIPAARFLVLILWGILLIQICLGLSNIIWALPLFVAVAHNAIGAVLLLVMVTLCHRIFGATTRSS